MTTIIHDSGLEARLGVVPFAFRLLAAEPRPQMEVARPESGRRWVI